MLQALMFLVATGRVPLFHCAKPQKVHRLSFKPLVGPVLSTSGIVRVTYYNLRGTIKLDLPKVNWK